jgi:hypothetical protein
MQFRILYLLALITLFQISGESQTIEGVVYGSDVEEPLPGAHVWLAGTTIGTQTDDNGYYVIHPNRKEYELVVSYLGYTSYQETMYGKDQVVFKRIDLERSNIELDEIEVRTAASGKRNKWIREFSKSFFGYSNEARKCKILNTDALFFREDSRGLHVIAHEPIEIELAPTGYRVLFLLQQAVVSGEKIQYNGKALFNELESNDENKLSKWNIKREKAYRGSLIHFFRSLIKNDLKKQGFEIYHSAKSGRSFADLGLASRDRILIKKEGEKENYILRFNGFLKIVYTKEKSTIVMSSSGGIGNIRTSLGQPAEREMIQHDKHIQGKSTGANNQVSWIFIGNSEVEIDQNGFPKEESLIEEFGYLSYERIAELLPYSYGMEEE